MAVVHLNSKTFVYTQKQLIISLMMINLTSHRITESHNCRGWKGPLDITDSIPLSPHDLFGK